MRASRLALLLTLTAALFVSAPLQAAELKLLDKPAWIFPGQTFRIAIEQAPGAGDLKVDAPPTLELFDVWPKDAIQRFYFRAVEVGDATLAFHGPAGKLEVPLEVIRWSDLFTPRQLDSLDLPRIWPMDDADYGHLKRRRTFHSDADLEAMRRRGAKVGGLAGKWAEMSDEEIWNIIPGPCVPRTCLIVLSGGGREDGRGKGCPVCGMKVYEGRSGFYPWIFDAKKHPWKVGCPSCGTWFPSNDWHKGDMHSGPFPDDGFGCEPDEPVIAPNGVPWRWPFVAYYHQWQAYMREFTPGIEQTATAFAQTGDWRYAHKAAIGLFRFAESMLDMSLNLSHRKMAVRDAILRGPVGAPIHRKRPSGTFLYIQPNWDTPRMEACARSWDLIFDALEGDDELLEFCRSRHHPEIQTLDDFRRFVEAGVIRVRLQACLDNAVSRNYPMQEVLAATLALVMDSPRSLDVVDWLLHEGAGIRFTLANDFFKDGSACESESYNHIHIRDMDRIFDLLERIRRLYPDEWEKRGLATLYGDPKYRLLYDFPIENSLIGCTTTWTGDTGHAITTDRRKPQQAFPLAGREFVNVYRRTRDPRFAQAMVGPGGAVPAELDDPALRAEVEKIVEERGWQVELESNVLDGYGHAILRSGAGDHQRALWLRYGRVVQHAHQDLLSIGLAALERDMLPELGYPQGWTYAGQWAANWGTHYGAHVTGVRSRDFGRGRLTLFADTAPARVASATSTLLPGKGHTRRSKTIVLVDLSPEDCYAVALDRVEGGEEHTWSFHGPDGTAVPFGLQLAPQDGGTVLGPDVAYGDYSSVAGVDSELACLAFMDDVARARPSGAWGLDYRLKGQEGAHLHATMIAPDGCELAVAKGRPPQGNRTYEMTWAILRRNGPAPLASRFVTVLEPYEGQRRIQRIEPVVVASQASGAGAAVGLRVTSGDFVDTIVLQDGEPRTCTTPDGIATDGRFAFWRERDGQCTAAVLVGGTTLARGDARVALPEAAYCGTVKRCDWKGGRVLVEPGPDEPQSLVGRHVAISNASGSHASYRIEAAEVVEGGVRLTLPFDPRIGEGFVAECEDGLLRSATKLRFAGYWRYYAGKTIANEDGSARYRLDDVAGGVRCVLDESAARPVDADTLRREFVDRDGDGRARFVIYDYGPGDRVTIQRSATTSE